MEMENYKNLNDELILQVQDQRLQIRNLEKMLISERKLFSEENELLKRNYKNLQENVVTLLDKNYTEFRKLVYPDEEVLIISNANKNNDARKRSSSSFSSNGQQSVKAILSNSYSSKSISNSNTFSLRKLRSIENFQTVKDLRSKSLKNSSEEHVSPRSENLDEQEILINDENDEHHDLNNIWNDNQTDKSLYNNQMLSKISEENEFSYLAEKSISKDPDDSYNCENNSPSSSNSTSLRLSRTEATLSDTTIKNLLNVPSSTPFKPTIARTVFKTLQVRVKRLKPEIINSLTVNTDVSKAIQYDNESTLKNKKNVFSESTAINSVSLSTVKEAEVFMKLKEAKYESVQNSSQKQRTGGKKSQSSKSLEEKSIGASLRPKRKATPTNLREQKLNVKMRRE